MEKYQHTTPSLSEITKEYRGCKYTESCNDIINFPAVLKTLCPKNKDYNFVFQSS